MATGGFSLCRTWTVADPVGLTLLRAMAGEARNLRAIHGKSWDSLVAATDHWLTFKEAMREHPFRISMDPWLRDDHEIQCFITLLERIEADPSIDPRLPRQLRRLVVGCRG
jgi:hypothetical protein